MGKLKGSKTEKNLLASFAGESQARNRYTYFSSAAKQEGYEQIAFYFADTADNEKEHAKRFFKFLEGGDLEITATYPAGKIGPTLENLKGSAAGEKHEFTVLYPEAAKIAEEEGFKDVAAAFRAIAKAEMVHEARYRKLLDNLEKGNVFKKSGSVKWKCRNCGYSYEGAAAPDLCPACLHPKAHFELFCENY